MPNDDFFIFHFFIWTPYLDQVSLTTTHCSQQQGTTLIRAEQHPASGVNLSWPPMAILKSVPPFLHFFSSAITSGSVCQGVLPKCATRPRYFTFQIWRLTNGQQTQANTHVY